MLSVHPKIKKGFTLVEVIVGAALFLIIAVGIYGAFRGVLTVIGASQSKIVAMDLANERFELIRNLPYEDVGIAGGIPSGLIQHVENFSRSGYLFTATTTVRNIDDPFDGQLGGNPNDLSPADYKLVEIEIGCEMCKNFQPTFVNTHVAPKNLETASTNGALFISVFDANGQPVQNASVHVENHEPAIPIIIDDETNANGELQIVDAPPGVNAYEITVTKSGYTTDQTLTPGAAGNPNPSRPHATVALQQVTQVSFVIDEVSTLNVSSMTYNCSAIPSVDFNLKGTKLIGTNPDVLKYGNTTGVDHITNGSGQKTINNLEWDTYPLTLTDAAYDLVGMNPISPLSIAQGATQNLKLIVAPKDPSTVLVLVKDASTQLPLASSTVRLQGPASYDESQITERGFLKQTDWSGGQEQATTTDPTKYFSSQNIDITNPVGEIKLTGSFGVFDSNGDLTSSTYDTGSASNFHEISWLPADQPPETGAGSVKMQIATNNNGETWNFVGPDGTASTYYTLPTSNISSVHNGDRYLRYKIFLSTADTAFTPNISDISFTFSSECVPPGQAAFSGLTPGTYTLSVTREGYQEYQTQISVGSSWQQEEVSLLPES